MATNPFFNQKHPGEQQLIESMVIEHIRMFGQDMVYVPREMIKEDRLFGEGKWYKFDDAFPIEMYIQDNGGFQGAGDLVSKFGLQIKDRINLVLAQKRFAQEVTAHRPDIKRPREGDLIFMPLSNSLFEINFVEHEIPFYVHGKNYSYNIVCELFNYDHSKMNTGVTEIDILESERHWVPRLLNLTKIPGITNFSFFEGETVSQYIELAGVTGAITGPAMSIGTLIQFIMGTTGTTANAFVTTPDPFTLTGTTILYGSSSAAKQYLSGQTASNTLIPKNSLTGDNFGDNDITALESNEKDIINYCDRDPFSEGTP